MEHSNSELHLEISSKLYSYYKLLQEDMKLLYTVTHESVQP